MRHYPTSPAGQAMAPTPEPIGPEAFAPSTTPSCAGSAWPASWSTRDFGLQGAVQMANAYPEAALLLHHWGSVDSPDFDPFNADPADLVGLVTHPERIHVVAPGEPFTLRRADDTTS